MFTFFFRHLFYYNIKNSTSFFFTTWGGVLFFLFIIQCISGAFLLNLYHSDWNFIFFDFSIVISLNSFLFLFQFLHSFVVHILFFFLFLHFFRIVLYNSYDSSRYLIFLFGYFLFIIICMQVISGFSISASNFGFWAGTVVSNLLWNFSFFENIFLNFIFGGFFFSNTAFFHFCFLHFFFLPFFMFFFLFLHLIFIHNRDKIIYDFKGFGLDFFSWFYFKNFFFIIFILFFLCISFNFFEEYWFIFTDHSPLHIAPEWFFNFFFIILKIFEKNFVIFLFIYLYFHFFVYSFCNFYFYNFFFFLKKNIKMI